MVQSITITGEKLLKNTVRVCVIEEDCNPGILKTFMYEVFNRIGRKVEVVHIRPQGFGASFRSLEDCCEHFGFTVHAVEEKLLPKE